MASTRFRTVLWATVLVVGSSVGAAHAATLSKKVINDGTTIGLANAQVAKDALGRIHLASQGRPAATFDSDSTTELYYMLLDSDGDVLIDATRINTADVSNEGRVDIAVLSDNTAVITWFRSGEALRYSLVDPSADDLSGDAGDPTDPLFLIETETVIGTNTNRGHHEIAVDANDIVHAVMCKSGSLVYVSFDPVAATVDNTETAIGTCEERVHPAMALDSAGDVHIAASSNDVAGEGEAAYYMLDGATGAVAIDATPLYTATALTPKAAHFTLWVDANDIVNVVYGDKRNTFDAVNWCTDCGQGGTMIYARLDPSLDDQSGDAADADVIRVGDEAEVGPLWYARAVPWSGRVNVIGSGGGRAGLLVHASVSTSGGSRKAPKGFDEQSGGFGWARHYVSAVDNKVFWSESVFVPTTPGTTAQLVLTKVASFADRGGGGGGGAPGLPALLVLALAGLSRLVRSSRALPVMIAAVALGIAVPSHAATLSKKVINDGSSVGLANVQVAKDSLGRIHIAAQGRAAANFDDDAFMEIYYMLVDADGDVLIDATQVNSADATREGRVGIALTSNDQAVITWFMSGEALRYSLVDPAGDDLSGDAADPTDPLFLIETETVIGTNTNRGHHAIAIDANDIVHAVMCKNDTLVYVSFDPVAATVDNTEAAFGTCEDHPGVAMALDSAGDVHVVASSLDLAGEGEAAYYMLDGATGTLAIDATPLYTATALAPKASHFTLWVDSNDIVSVVYGDKRNTFDSTNWCTDCGQGGTMIYTRLDPSLDDQNGNAADADVIRVGEEVEVGPLWYAKAVPWSGRVNVIGNAGGRAGLLVHASVSTSGGSRKAPKVFDEQAGGFGWSRHYVSAADNKVFWSESVFVPTTPGATAQLVMTKIASFADRGGGGGGAPGLPLLLGFGLVGLLRLARK